MTYNVTIHEWPDYNDPCYVGRQTILNENNHKLFSVSNLADCPEDAIIPRDLFNAYDWITTVRFGLYLAKQGYTDINVTDIIQEDRDD